MDGNHKWIGKAAAALCALLIYAGSYYALRHHFTGSIVNREGNIVVEQLKLTLPATMTTNRIEMPAFGPGFPQLPLALNKALNVCFYPVQQADQSLTGRKLIFHVEFPVTPPHPTFFPTR